MRSKLAKANQRRASQPATAPLFQQLTLADAISLLNLLAGFGAILLAMAGRIDLAAAAILIAVVLDGLDGWFARSLSATHDLGKQLDSLADLVSFGVAPAALLFATFGDAVPGIAFPLALLVLCGALRLARFNALKDSDGYLGLPITGNGIIAPMLIDLNAPAGIAVALAVLGSALMVSNIRIRKSHLLYIASGIIIIWVALHAFGVRW